MSEGEDWLMRPVLAGCCRLESLLDGTLDLENIAAMNDALTVKSENDYRAHKAMEKR